MVGAGEGSENPAGGVGAFHGQDLTRATPLRRLLLRPLPACGERAATDVLQAQSGEGLQQYRDLLEPGSAVLLMLSAELQGEEVRARIQMAEPLDKAASKLQKALRVFLRDPTPIESVAKRLDGQGDGEVSVVLMLREGTEVEVKLPGRFKISPQVAGAIKAIPGVIEVQAL